MSRVAIPLADAPELLGLARRTAIVRWLLALAVAAVAVAAVVSTRTMRVGSAAFLAPGSAGTIVLDLSSSTEAAPPEQISLALRRVAASGRQAGLVLFSDTAYEAVPPQAKAIELRPYLRYFAPPRDFDPFRPFSPQQQRSRANPWMTFRGGTRISSGLRLAAEMVEKSSRRSVLLISDLNDSLFDLPQLSRVLKDYVRKGISLKIVALNPNPSDREFWTNQLGEQAFVPDESLRAPVTRRHTQLVGDFPSGLIALGVVLAVLLALNELWSTRLQWREAS